MTIERMLNDLQVMASRNLSDIKVIKSQNK